MEYRTLFGPVPSRRMGLSLGVDLVPRKVCNFNCVYCECGRTTELTQERGEYVPLFRVLEELKDFFRHHPTVDYITFSGSGEPLLNKGIAGVVDFIKQNYPGYKVALLTNGSFLSSREIRAEVMSFDLIVPSLDAISKSVFRKINRPAPGIEPLEMVEGLCRLREEFRGRLWLEIFIVPGINDTAQELDLLSKAAERIRPEKVQLNFLDRPGAEEWVRRPTAEEIARILPFFKRVQAEPVAGPREGGATFRLYDHAAENIMSIIRRRPSTAQDISMALKITVNEAHLLLDRLLEEGRVEFKTEERGVFFRVK